MYLIIHVFLFRDWSCKQLAQGTQSWHLNNPNLIIETEQRKCIRYYSDRLPVINPTKIQLAVGSLLSELLVQTPNRAPDFRHCQCPNLLCR